MSKVLIKLNVKHSNLVTELQSFLNEKFKIESIVIPMPHIEEPCETECPNLDSNMLMQIKAASIDFVISK